MQNAVLVILSEAMNLVLTVVDILRRSAKKGTPLNDMRNNRLAQVAKIQRKILHLIRSAARVTRTRKPDIPAVFGILVNCRIGFPIAVEIRRLNISGRGYP